MLDHGQGGFQPGHAHRSLRPLAFLVLARVRGVVGAHHVNGAVRQAGAQCLNICIRPQRRVDLVHRVVAADQVVGEQEVVRGDFGSDVDAAFLGPADDLHGAGGGDVADVQAGVHMLRQQDVTGDDAFLGDRRPAGESQDGGDGALVHLGPGGKAGFLRVLGHHAVERFDVLQGAAHQHRIVDADAVIGKHADLGARIRHGTEFGELVAGQADGHGADGTDVHPAGRAAQAVDLFHHTGGIRHRVAVGHGVDRGEAAQGGGAGAGLYGFGIFAAGFAQVCVHVHHAGQCHQAGGFDDGGAVRVFVGGSDCAPGGDDAVTDEQLLGPGAQDRCTADQVGSVVLCHQLLSLVEWAAFERAALVWAVLARSVLVAAPTEAVGSRVSPESSR